MKMIKFILAFLLLMGITNLTYAYDYDPLLMRAQASIFPKIIMLDKDVSNKVEADHVVISILHSMEETSAANNIKDLIRQQYKTNLGERKLKIHLIKFSDFDESVVSTAYFLLKGSEHIHTKISSHAASQQRLVFSYDYKDFKSNALVSVLMKEKTYIYLNKSAIHVYDIKFLPLFYKIVQVVE